MEKVKEIIGTFVDESPSSINNNTLIDRTALKSSILVHRMYAALAKEGYVVNNYLGIVNYGDLLGALRNDDTNHKSEIKDSIANLPVPTQDSQTGNSAIGIDIEMINKLPITTDYREDFFYLENFSVSEISHCLLAPSPRSSFAGLFSAKEAICKCDNTFRKSVFKNINIKHEENGKPFFNGFNISISYTDEYVVAVAFKDTKIFYDNFTNQPPKLDLGINKKDSAKSTVINIVTFIISLLALLIGIYCLFQVRK